MPAQPKTRDFGWNGDGKRTTGGQLMHFGKMHGTVVRALDVGFGHTKFVSSVDGGEVRCMHFPSVAYPTGDETTDHGRPAQDVGIPIDGLIYEVGP
jgi:hypothetical protein